MKATVQYDAKKLFLLQILSSAYIFVRLQNTLDFRFEIKLRLQGSMIPKTFALFYTNDINMDMLLMNKKKKHQIN